MREHKSLYGRAVALPLVLWLLALAGLVTGHAQPAHGASVIRPGAVGPDVVMAQHFLYQLGYLNASPDGLFGAATERAVRRFQDDRGLASDGVVGPATWKELKQALDSEVARVHVVQRGESLWLLARRYGVSVDAIAGANGIADPSRIREGAELIIPGAGGGRAPSRVELLPWQEAREIYANFKVATVIDIRTGKQFKVRRYYGTYHADSEPLTAQDAAVMREIYGGWSWERRPIIVEVDGRRIAASMNGMPHGDGSIAENGFPGHFCIHFLGSAIHRTGLMDVDHQTAVLRAAGYTVSRMWLNAR